METIILKIAGMKCLACVAHLEKSLEAVPRVNSVHVELNTGEATIQHEHADTKQLSAAVESAGYNVASLKAGS